MSGAFGSMLGIGIASGGLNNGGIADGCTLVGAS